MRNKVFVIYNTKDGTYLESKGWFFKTLVFSLYSCDAKKFKTYSKAANLLDTLPRKNVYKICKLDMRYQDLRNFLEWDMYV